MSMPGDSFKQRPVQLSKKLLSHLVCALIDSKFDDDDKLTIKIKTTFQQ